MVMGHGKWFNDMDGEQAVPSIPATVNGFQDRRLDRSRTPPMHQWVSANGATPERSVGEILIGL